MTPDEIEETVKSGQITQESIAELLNAETLTKVDPPPVVIEQHTAVDEEIFAEEQGILVAETPAEEIIEMPEVKENTETPAEEIIVITRKPQNVVLAEEFTSETAWDEDADTVILPSAFDRETREVLDQVPKVNILDDPKSRDWAKTVSEGLGVSTFNETYLETLEESNADFHQFIEQNGTKLAGAQPKFKQAENQNLVGERAVIRMMSHLGLGTLFQVPLWHSGIWITFKAPSESEIIELNRKIMTDKIELGRHTYGLAFSNTSSYTTDRLVDFAIDHVYDTSLLAKEVGIADLKGLIDCQDIPSLIWGFVCTMYPRGFQYRRGCVVNPEKCNHVLNELLNVTKLQWVNRAALTEWQKTHMSVRRANSKDKASIIRYKEEMAKTQKRRILFNEGLSTEIALTLKTPTIAQYVDAGHRWISEMVELVDRTLGLEAKEAERNSFITRHGQASAMRQYVHWVESIEIDTNVINDWETIEATLTSLSADNTIRNSFIDNVIKYINHSTVAVIGIPVYDCPACKETQASNISLPQHANVIPLDVMQLFFDLITQRLTKITER